MAERDRTRTYGEPRAERGRTRARPELSGWTVFAAVVLLILGSLDFFWGLAALLEDENLVVGGNGVLIVDFTAWGWVTLILGAIQVLVGLGLVAAQEWARWAAVFFAALAAIAQIGIVTAFPIWSLIIILLSILVIYHLTARWEGPV
jgi:hypothetical protein